MKVHLCQVFYRVGIIHLIDNYYIALALTSALLCAQDAVAFAACTAYRSDYEVPLSLDLLDQRSYTLQIPII
jgi:hypothetical protein